MNRFSARRGFSIASLLARLKATITRLGFGWGHKLKLGDVYRLGSGKVRVPLDGAPIEITFGQTDKRLHIYPETRIDRTGSVVHCDGYIVVDPRTHLRRIGGFLRLGSRSWLALGTADTVQRALFEYPEVVDDQHLVIICGRDGFVFRNLSAAGTSIAPVIHPVQAHRTKKLRQLRALIGGPLELLPREEALRLIHAVTHLLGQEGGRAPDDRGLPGGLLVLPQRLTPIVIGDLHARIDNFLTVLTQNAFLDALEEGGAALVILGDAVHSERDGELRNMDSSMLMMDLIFRLKLRFPEQVFYVRGNHDAFSEDITKDGVPQGLLWAKSLSEKRGSAYLKAMDDFYRLLPYVVASDDFVACHAAPPTHKITPEMLVNIYRYPELLLDLINNRPQRTHHPQGYNRRDIKRFRRALQLDPATPVIVGHTPLDNRESVWLDVDGIANHHVLYSAHPEQVGVFTRVGNLMIPLTYPVDSLTPIMNALPD